ncbi:MAG: hypothetical protein IJ136_04585 [Erysipelotrichaceae bacterium]|jgi:hypothetical protein|nr:hypothetical protein [Erysipelotrichaceae bacterium]MBQ1379383.1 hypothetical protein [Erysipelotrichaceae bacterium]MBQ2078908.1 hypothetical protein [Erysipelotrichaceae bacterium]MBQ2506346.1 hypothetical protein [Erysipelotrichaceae bacterium]MBQ2655148.1 hypothetical protein [Erysipelotrichaceae bacterium]
MEEKKVKLVAAVCTQCGAQLEVDPNAEAAVCKYCNTPFIVEKAINNYNVQHANIEHADNVNIDMTGAVKSALDFVGDQMKESRQHKKEMFRMKAENEKQFFVTFFKFFGIFAIVVIILWVILRNFM